MLSTDPALRANVAGRQNKLRKGREGNGMSSGCSIGGSLLTVEIEEIAGFFEKNQLNFYLTCATPPPRLLLAHPSRDPASPSLCPAVPRAVARRRATRRREWSYSRILLGIEQGEDRHQVKDR